MPPYAKFREDWADGETANTPVTGDALDHIESGIAAALPAADLDQSAAALVGNPATDTGAAVLGVADARAAAAVGSLSIPVDADDLIDGATQVMMTAAERVNLADVKAVVDGATDLNTNGALVRRSAGGRIAVSGIAGLGAPAAADEAANKAYVDAAVVEAAVSTEQVQDIIGATVIAGAGINIAYDDATGTVEVNTVSGGAVGVADLPPGSVLYVRKSAGLWGSRPTARADVLVFWDGPDPDPPIVASGTAGMLEGDKRLVTP